MFACYVAFFASPNPLLAALAQDKGIPVRIHQPYCRAEVCTLYSSDKGGSIKWKSTGKTRHERPNVCCLIDIFLETFYAHDYRLVTLLCIHSCKNAKISLSVWSHLLINVYIYAV